MKKNDVLYLGAGVLLGWFLFRCSRGNGADGSALPLASDRPGLSWLDDLENLLLTPMPTGTVILNRPPVLNVQAHEWEESVDG